MAHLGFGLRPTIGMGGCMRDGDTDTRTRRVMIDNVARIESALPQARLEPSAVVHATKGRAVGS